MYLLVAMVDCLQVVCGVNFVGNIGIWGMS
jgi:hypothetical protein